MLKYIWQLPQHLLALLILKLYKKKIVKLYDYKTSKVYILDKTLFGVSLGKYIILSTYHNNTTVKHEYGHSIQSKYFGLFYLIIIGIPSITMNILSMLMGGKFAANYYNRWPESWADKLGEVTR